jgi:peptide/nickel transport system permease protein
MYSHQQLAPIASPQKAWKRFQRNKPALLSLYAVFVLISIALLADVLANNKPLYCKYRNEAYFPVFHEFAADIHLAKPQNIDWKKAVLKQSIWPLVRYLPNELDFANAQFVSPFGKQHVISRGWRHRLGTDALGQDVLSGIFHGTRIALSVGIFSMLLASMIGIIMGLVSGYFGDSGIKISRASVITGCFFVVIAFFYGFQCRAEELEDSLRNSFPSFLLELLISKLIFITVMGIGYLVSRPLKFLPWLSKKIPLPLDIIISRFIEVFNSIPRLLLIFSVAMLTRPSLNVLTLVIGLTSWTEIARFVRAEMLRIRGLSYMESASALGYSRFRIIFRHALPNALAPVLITISFGIAAAILTESALSFLGIGVPIDSLTWGKLLSSAREAPSAWWLAIFPGMAIFITVTAFNLIAEGLNEAMDPKEG